MAEFPFKKPEEIRLKKGPEFILPPSRIDQSVADYLREQGIKAPPIKFGVFSGGHATIRDGELLGEHVRVSDIFFMEGFGWDDTTHKIYNGLSAGLIKPDLAISLSGRSRDFRSGLYPKLYGSGVKVAFADLPGNHPEMANSTLDDIDKKIREADSFVEVLKFTAKGAIEAVEQDELRDKYFLGHIGPEIGRVLINSPKLQNKSTLRVIYSSALPTQIILRGLQTEGRT
ncbi:MAG: hypothetical protein AAB965_01540 [Patescibacteria group bacterium]